MPERAEHIPTPPPLDDQVDRLLADSDANIEATAEAADDDALEFASPEELLNQVNDSMQTLAAETDAAAAELVEAELTRSAQVVSEPVGALESPAVEPPSADAPTPGDDEPTAPLAGNTPARAVLPDAGAPDDFTSPETITRLDERLAANAQALSDAAPEADVGTAAPLHTELPRAAAPANEAIAADEVDDAEIQSQIAAEEAAAAPAKPAPAPSPASMPTRAVAATPAPAAVPAATPAVAPPPSRAEAPLAPEMPAKAPRQFHIGAMLSSAAAACVRPIANYTSGLNPTVRQTIGYAALVTIFQAACLWGFLIFRGPPADPAPVGDPMVLRKVGDDAEHAARMKAAAQAKPKKASNAESADHSAPKAETKGKAPAKKDDHGGH